MSYKNYMKLELPSYYSNMAFARTAVASFVSQLDPTLDELGDIRTAVSEAVSNCIVHAYPNEIGLITIRCRILKENVISITVKDNGIGIPDVLQTHETMYTTGGEEHSGMGFMIMKSFMTDLKVVSAPGKGTVVHMKRKISKPKGDEHEQSETEEAVLCDSGDPA